jgi:hypothetical protein
VSFDNNNNNNNNNNNMTERYRQALAHYLAEFGVTRTVYGNYSDKFGGFIIVPRGNDVAKLYKTGSLFAGQTHFFMSCAEYEKIERLKKRILQAEQLESMRANPDRPGRDS